jgi:tetratricopeptide (TPR) repeat protein
VRKSALFVVPALAAAALLLILLLGRKDRAHDNGAPLPESRIRPVPPEPPPPVPPVENPAAAATRLFTCASDKAAQGHYREAVADFDRAIGLRPDWMEAYYSRGVSRMLLNDYAGAITDYDRAIELKGGGAEAYYNRALARSALGKDKEALSDYDHAIRERNTWPEAYYNRALLKHKLGDRAGAGEDARQALQLAPANWPSRPAVEKLLSTGR